MKVRMNIHITGSRNGLRWPPVGGEVDLPAGEAGDLISQGFAAAVEIKGAASKPEPEKAVAPKPETRKKS